MGLISSLKQGANNLKERYKGATEKLDAILEGNVPTGTGTGEYVPEVVLSKTDKQSTQSESSTSLATQTAVDPNYAHPYVDISQQVTPKYTIEKGAFIKHAQIYYKFIDWDKDGNMIMEIVDGSEVGDKLFYADGNLYKHTSEKKDGYIRTVGPQAFDNRQSWVIRNENKGENGKDKEMVFDPNIGVDFAKYKVNSNFTPMKLDHVEANKAVNGLSFLALGENNLTSGNNRIKLDLLQTLNFLPRENRTDPAAVSYLNGVKTSFSEHWTAMVNFGGERKGNIFISEHYALTPDPNSLKKAYGIGRNVPLLFIDNVSNASLAAINYVEGNNAEAWNNLQDAANPLKLLGKAPGLGAKFIEKGREVSNVAGKSKGKTFRGGDKKSRDKWYGYNDKDFQNWWHRKGKREFGGNDIDIAAEAAEIYKYWESIGKPKVK